MSRLAIAIAVCTLSSATFAQPADGKQAAAERFAEGQRHFEAGEYLAAATDFEEAYKLDPDPVYLYNTAQAYRHGSACARAADYYRRFLEVVPNPPNLEKVQHYLHDLDACAKVESSGDSSATKPVEPATPAPAPVVTLARVDEPVVHDARPLAISAAGIALVAAGAWFTHDVSTLEGYSTAQCPSGSMCQWDATKQARAADLQHRGTRATDLSIVGYGAGGAAVITGIALYYLSGHRNAAIQHVDGGAVVVTTLSF
jgi:tetratricopeptide (TPR) repeat protein